MLSAVVYPRFYEVGVLVCAEKLLCALLTITHTLHWICHIVSTLHYILQPTQFVHFLVWAQIINHLYVIEVE